MPDILIRGMEMPRSCMGCRLNYGEKRPEHGLTIVCKYSNGVVLPEVTGIVGRLPTCGLLELSEHGDLISKDDAMNAILGEPPEAHYPSWYAAIVNEIPAIVPSNKEPADE